MTDYLALVDGGTLRVYAIAKGKAADQVAQIRTSRAMTVNEAVKLSMHLIDALPERNGEPPKRAAAVAKRPPEKQSVNSRASGLTYGDVMRVINEHPDGMTTRELAEHFGVAPRAITSVMSYPRRQGMVRSMPASGIGSGNRGHPQNKYYPRQAPPDYEGDRG